MWLTFDPHLLPPFAPFLLLRPPHLQPSVLRRRSLDHPAITCRLRAIVDLRPCIVFLFPADLIFCLKKFPNCPSLPLRRLPIPPLLLPPLRMSRMDKMQTVPAMLICLKLVGAPRVRLRGSHRQPRLLLLFPGPRLRPSDLPLMKIARPLKEIIVRCPSLPTALTLITKTEEMRTLRSQKRF